MSTAHASQGAPVMKPVWLLLWAAAIGQVAVWAFVPVSPDHVPSLHTEESGEERILGYEEDIHVQSRADLRKETLVSLEQPWAGRCGGESKKNFVLGLNEYYYHRQNQTERYAENFGRAGAKYIAQQWSAPDDKRIDRLAQEAYAKGYLRPADFNGLSRKLIDAVISEERVTGKGCER